MSGKSWDFMSGSLLRRKRRNFRWRSPSRLLVMNSRCLSAIVPSLFAFLFAVALLSERVDANPADSAPCTLTQPDGTSFMARLMGDEHFSYDQTEDGYPISRDPETRWWHYAGKKEEGVGDPEGGRVGAAARPTERWTPQIPRLELEARQTRYRDTASVPTGLKNGIPGKGVKTTGGPGEVQNANVAMLLTIFADTAGLTHITAANFEKEYFDTDPSSFSARELYRQMSYDKHLIGSGPEGIEDWVTAPNNRAFYGDRMPYAPNTTREDGAAIQELVRWRVEAVPSSFDWGKYDVDNDGWVDLVCLVFQGGSQSQAGGRVEDLWPIRFLLDADQSNSARGIWSTGDTNENGDPVFVRDFIIVPECGPVDPATGLSTIKSIGTFCHEYGHGIGWPDLYDNDSSSEGVGRFCVMGTGGFNSSAGGRSGDRPPWANPWCRARCGWVTPENLTANLQRRTLKPVSQENVALRLWSAGTRGSEYYLAENRVKSGFDIDLPDEGLLIWHINEAHSNNVNEW
jgi:M6 family metalloprotease-like protein